MSDEEQDGSRPGWAVAVIAAAVVIVLGGITVAGAVFIAVIGGAVASNTAAQAAAGSCLGAGSGGGVVLAGPSAGGGLTRENLSPTQLERAGEIVAVGEQRGLPQRAVVIALAVAAQESGFQNLANDGTDSRLKPDQAGVGRSRDFPHDGVGRDHGSLNAFQQQWPWWGSFEVLMDPPSAAGLFYDALLEVPGWEQLPLTVAAQRTQRSAFPDAYADDEALAVQLATELAGAGAAAGGDAGDVEFVAAGGPVLCGGGAALTCAPTNLAVEQGLTPDALRVLRCVQETFGDHTYGGVGERAANPGSDHPTGRAVDVMVEGWDTPAGRAHGDEVAAYLEANAAGLGVRYVIWAGQIWHAERADEGWGPYTHPSGGGGPTLDHYDHVHVSVYGDAATAPAASGPWVLPTTGPLTSPFGMRMHPIKGYLRMHNGQDIAPPAGTPVVAASAGVVTHASPMGTYGNLVIITHDGGVQTYYAHLQNGLMPAVGQPVQPGQQIARVGSTGGSTGPHLHFEVRVGGEPVDPVGYLAGVGVVVPIGRG